MNYHCNLNHITSLDQVTTNENNDKPNSSKSTKYAGDRFIANRASTNYSYATFLISDPNLSSFHSKEISSPILVKDQNNESFTRLLEDTLFSNMIHDKEEISNNSSPPIINRELSKILAYRSKNHKVSTCLNDSIQSIFKHAAESNEIQKSRYISPLPEKILDAPEILDDYYLNLMDWSLSNILAISLNQNLYLWNYSNGAITLLLSDPVSQITSVGFMKNGNGLAIGFANSALQLWDIEKSRPLRSLPGHNARVSSLSWNHHLLSSGSRDTEILNHDVRNAINVISKYRGHSQEVCGLRWSLDFSQLASGSNDNNLIIWDPVMNNIKVKFTDHKAAVKALAWSPWQKGILASGGGTADKCIKFWNCDTGHLLKNHETDSQVSSLIWNRFDKEILSSHGYLKNQLSLWKYPKMQKIIELKGHLNRILQMCESPDGEMVVSAGADETLRFWKIFEKKEKIDEKFEKDEIFLKNNQVNIR